MFQQLKSLGGGSPTTSSTTCTDKGKIYICLNAYRRHLISRPMQIVEPIGILREKNVFKKLDPQTRRNPTPPLPHQAVNSFFFVYFLFTPVTCPCHLSLVTCHLSPVTFQVPHVMCHLSHVMFHLSHVMCHYKNSHNNRPSP